MSVAHTTDLYVAVRTKDQPHFSQLMDARFEHTSAEEAAQIFKSVRAEIPQRWDQDFRCLLLQWMAQDSTSAMLCQQSLSQLGFATLQHGDFPNVYDKIGVSYLLHNYPQNPTHAANSILNTTAFFNCPNSFGVLLENSEFRRHLDLSVNPEQRKLFGVITHPDSRNSYYKIFWNSLEFNQNWCVGYLLNVLRNRNTQALNEFLIQHPQTSDQILSETFRCDLHLNYTHVAEALPHFPNVWQSCALKYILARNLLQEGTFEPIAHLSAKEQIRIFDGVAEYWCAGSGFTYIFDNDLRREPIFKIIMSNFPSALGGWVASDKDPLWHSHILPKTPELQRYILQHHLGQTQQNLKKSKI